MNRAELKALLATVGVTPRKRLGQNFCVDDKLCEAIVRDSGLQADELCLEIGPGAGALTERLLERCRAVLACELDAGLARLLRSRFGDRPDFTLLEGDALERKNALSPALVAALDAVGDAGLESAAPGTGLRVVANLPYAIATPLTILLLELERPIRGLTVLVQREFAERICAPPGSKEYGAATVLARILATAKITRKVPASVFHPRPKVESAVLQLEPRELGQGAARPGYRTLRGLVRGLFNYRRKTLSAAARNLIKQDSTYAGLPLAIERVDLDASTRVESLTDDAFLELALALETAAEAEGPEARR